MWKVLKSGGLSLLPTISLPSSAGLRDAAVWWILCTDCHGLDSSHFQNQLITLQIHDVVVKLLFGIMCIQPMLVVSQRPKSPPSLLASDRFSLAVS